MTIDAQIGQIHYQRPDNLLLQQLMENLNDFIQINGAQKVNEILSKGKIKEPNTEVEKSY